MRGIGMIESFAINSLRVFGQVRAHGMRQGGVGEIRHRTVAVSEKPLSGYLNFKS
jgi:hypothetical protein